MIKPGRYSDIKFDNEGRLVEARSLDGRVIVDVDNVQVMNVDVLEHNHLMFLTMVIHHGVYLCGKSNSSGHTVVIRPDGSKIVIPFGHGNYSCHLSVQSGNVVVYVMLSADVCGIYNTEGNFLSSIASPTPTAAQGIRYINSDREIFWADLTNFSFVKDRPLNEIMTEQGITIGQFHQDNHIGLACISTVRPEEFEFLAFNEPVFHHRIAVSGSRIALTRALNNTIRTEVFNPPYPKFPTVIKPEPQPEPEPIPEPNRMKHIPQQVKDIIRVYVKKFGVPEIVTHENQEHFEGRCRLWIKKLAETIRAITHERKWGTKKSSGPQSKDAIAYDGTPLVSWDLLTGVGTGKPSLNNLDILESDDITGQTFIEVAAIDWLEMDDEDQPDPIDNDEIKKDIARLELEVAKCILNNQDRMREISELRLEVNKLREEIKNNKPTTEIIIPDNVAREGWPVVNRSFGRDVVIGKIRKP